MKFDVGILANQPVPMIVRQVQLAERLGFDTAWILEMFADEVIARV